MTPAADPPNDEPTGADGLRIADWWHPSGDAGEVVCELCPRGCSLGPGRRGFCFVRRNCDGRLMSTTYGRSTGFCIDPIEKKPLFHFYPGTPILSFGTAGCNLGCVFCQNWSTSKAKQTDVAGEAALPEDIARSAREHGCRSVAFTYNEPIVWAEYAIDTARACRIEGLHTVAVTAGYIAAPARRAFFESIDAANVDLKGFSDDFYRTMAAGRLEPVCDTLRWLVHESNVWVEITNLLIPRANDSPEMLQAMCDWIARELRPDVPIHFSAFHPDYKLRDREPTPIATVEMACRIARRAGLQYVYAGNLRDAQAQSTYCAGCGKLLIQRDGYELGEYAVRDSRCRHCGATLPGRFDDVPGHWGSGRQPVRICPSAPRPAPNASAAGETRLTLPDEPRTPSVASPSAASPSAASSSAASPSAASPSVASPSAASSRAASPDVDAERPPLSPEQAQALFRAAGRRVASVVRRQPPPPRDEVVAAVAGLPILGAFVSLKRAGQLRSCCGSMGSSVALGRALDEAAVRAAKDDPRFPPISQTELDHLDMEVWLLWGMRPVDARQLDRVATVEIGRHGLQIARGRSRGLLLPSVAVDHHLDAEAFLRQVCLKAGLPDDAWKDDDTTLSTFEGFAIKGTLAAALAEVDDAARRHHESRGQQPDRRQDHAERLHAGRGLGQDSAVPTIPDEAAWPPGGPSPADVARLAEFCRGNVMAMLHGATPSYYLPDAFDGNVCGVILTARLATAAETFECSRISPQAEVPLQSSLTTCAGTMAQRLASLRATPDAIARMRCGLSVLWAPAMHGTLSEPDMAGLDTRRRAVVVVQRDRWAAVYDREATAEALLDGAVARGRIDRNEPAMIYSLAVVSTLPRSGASNVAVPQSGSAVRPPAAAGRFYPGNAGEVGRALDGMLPGDMPKQRWAGALVPHAGWVYSGRLAADVLRRVEIPSHVIVVCPKHHAGGSEWAVAPHRVWALPGRELASDPELAAALAAAVDGFALDAEAHRPEHAVEVQLPILARLAPDTRAIGIAMSASDPARLQRAADQLAAFLAALPERPLLVISTDMNHYADDAHTRRIDRHALDAIERLDPEGLFQTVAEHRISMCGVVPAVFVLQTLRRLGALAQCQRVGYTTSAETSGDPSHVVGYAGYLFR